MYRREQRKLLRMIWIYLHHSPVFFVSPGGRISQFPVSKLSARDQWRCSSDLPCTGLDRTSEVTQGSLDVGLTIKIQWFDSYTQRYSLLLLQLFPCLSHFLPGVRQVGHLHIKQIKCQTLEDPGGDLENKVQRKKIQKTINIVLITISRRSRSLDNRLTPVPASLAPPSPPPPPAFCFSFWACIIA